MEDLFGQWLSLNCDISKSTIGKYKRAIRAVSKDMIEEGILQGDLYSISSWEKYESVKAEILANDFFIDKDTRGHRMYSRALNLFGEFLKKR